ncbi:MAG: chromate transporter [Oscillospiraceae bacterium]|nr:chromate transporter [Oscillospiraceae bacterium]
MKVYLQLFFTFTYIGAVSFGGGYSMLPMFQRELVSKKAWLSETEMIDYFSVSQCLPGIIAANAAVFVGYKQKKVFGGIIAAIGAVFPSLVIITIIAALLTNFAEIELVQNAFAGIRVCVSVLIINTVIRLWKQAIIDKSTLVLFSLVFLLSVLTSLPVAIMVAVAGTTGIAIQMLRKVMKAK